MKKRNSVLFISIYVILLCACLLLSSCGEKKQEMKTNKLSPDIYPAANVEYEYNSDGLPAAATVFKGEKVFCKYEYVYGEDGILEKRLEKNSKDILLCEYEYEDGKTLEYKTVYSEDGAVEKKFKYDKDGLMVKRTNYNADGNEVLEIDYDEDGNVFLTTEYRYYDDGALSKVTKTGEQGVAELLFYDRDGILTDEFKYTYYSYRGYKIRKHTKYDEEGCVETVREDKYSHNSDHLISVKAFREDGTIIYHQINDDNNSNVVRHIEYDENGVEVSLKCFDANGLIHYVTYDSGKTLSWSEYKYDENGEFLEKIEHSVEGIYVEPDGDDAEIYTYDVP